MAYFSNGTEGDAFEAAFCDRCVHQGDADKGESCAVFMAHLLYNYDDTYREVLDLLITGDTIDGTIKCQMFRDKLAPDERKRQQELSHPWMQARKKA